MNILDIAEITGKRLDHIRRDILVKCPLFEGDELGIDDIKSLKYGKEVLLILENIELENKVAKLEKEINDYKASEIYRMLELLKIKDKEFDDFKSNLSIHL